MNTDAPPVDVSAFPDPLLLIDMPLEQRAAVVRKYTNLVQERVALLLQRRLEAGVALHLQHGWPGVRIYQRWGVPRRTFTSWIEDGKGRNLPRAEEEQVVAEGDAAHAEYLTLAPVLQAVQSQRTAVYREMRKANRTSDEIMALTGMTADRLRLERRHAQAAGVTFPRPPYQTTKVANLVRRRIRKGTYPAGGMLPGENQLAAELKVGRTVIELALKQLRAEGLVVSRPKVGWFVIDQTKAEVDQVTDDTSSARAEPPATAQ